MAVSLQTILASLSACVMLVGTPALAQEWSVRGHLKHQTSHLEYPSASVGQDAFVHDSDFRLNAARDWQRVQIDSGIQILSREGVPLQRLLPSALRSAPATLDDETRFLDLSSDIVERGEWSTIARADRLSISFNAGNWVTRLGRQAVSFGNGLAFQVLDPFNPFAPTSIDKEYKTGDDMLFTQYLLASGADLQLLAIPRRDEDTRNLEHEESSYAAKFHGRWEDALLDYDVLAARHFNDTLIGTGASRDLFEAVFRADIALTSTADSNAVSLLFNVDRSFTILQTNVYGFVEYLRNGFASHEPYNSVSSALRERLARGELYTLARHYMATGGRVELSPRLNLHASVLLNLNDTSSIFQTRLVFDALQDLFVSAGATLPFGGRGSEYGGIALGGDTFAAPPQDLYLRIEYYFSA